MTRSDDPGDIFELALLAKIIHGCGYLWESGPNSEGGRLMRYDGECELTEAEVDIIDRIIGGDDDG